MSGHSSTSPSLHIAAEEGNVEAVAKFIAEGAEVSAGDEYGQHPLHYASVFGSNEVIKLLIKANADVNCITKHNTTPLHYAARNGQAETVALLLKHNAFPNCKDSDAWTPLHYACFRGHSKTAEYLLDSGADVTDENVNGHTPLHLACSKGFLDMAAMLIERGASVTAKNKRGDIPLILFPLEEKAPPEAVHLTPESLLNDFRTLYNTISSPEQTTDPVFFSDIIFRIESATSPPIHAHRVVLASRSQYMCDLLEDDASSGSWTGSEVVIQDCKEVVWRAMLEYLYCGTCKLLNETDLDSLILVKDLMTTSHLYCIESLTNLCENYLCHHLRRELVHQFWEEIFSKCDVAPGAKRPTNFGKLFEYLSQFTVRHFMPLNPQKIIASIDSSLLPLFVRCLTIKKPEANKTQVKQQPRVAPSPKQPSYATTTESETSFRPHKLDGRNLKIAKSINAAMRKHKHAFMFNQPVDPIQDGVPNYRQIIKRPMDLGTIKNNLDKGVYADYNEFASDVRQVWINAITFNMPGSEIHTWAQELSAMFEKKFAAGNWERIPGVGPPSPAKPLVPEYPPTASHYAAAAQVAAAAQAAQQGPATSQPYPVQSPTSEQNKRKKIDEPSGPMTLEEKQALGTKMNNLDRDQLAQVINIVSVDQGDKAGDIELDLSEMPENTLRVLENYVNECLQKKKKMRTDE